MNKKGISPLIATILVIGITVIIAVLVTTWLQSSTEGLKCTQECQVQGSSACQFSYGELEATLSGETVTVSNTGSQSYNLTFVTTSSSTGSTVENGIVSESVAGFDVANSNMTQGGDEIKVIAGVYPEVEGCAECEFIKCWESETLS